jgi:glycosyltransferase involved in cell wall biosynthesis
MKRVSVIIPVYNTPADWLAECLESLRGQTYSDWEAAIVDDASSVPVVLRDCASGDGRIRVLRHEANRGVAAARNTAASFVHGEFLLTLDADDRLKPSFIAASLAALEADSGADCAVGDFSVFGEATRLWKNKPKSPREMVLDQWMPGPGVLMRRALYDRVGGYPEDEVFRLGNEDWDFWLGVVEGGLRVVYLPEALYEYRVSSSSLSNTVMKRGYYRTAEAMYKRHRSFIDGFGLSRRFRFDGYFFSIRRCPSSELAFVVRRALSLVPRPRDAGRVVLAAAKRLAKAALVRFVRGCEGETA